MEKYFKTGSRLKNFRDINSLVTALFRENVNLTEKYWFLRETKIIFRIILLNEIALIWRKKLHSAEKWKIYCHA